MRQRPRRRLLPLLVLPFLLLFSGAPAFAGGAQHIPNGLTDFMSGVLPPPGVYWLNYLAYFGKDKALDKNGDEVPGVDLDAGVWAEVPRFVWITPVKILGANYGVQGIFPLYMADVKVKAGGTTLIDSDSKGLGDITLDPIVLAWHFSPNFHAGFGVDVVIPLGKYDKDDASTQILSRNHWTFENVFSVSYWTPGGLDLSAKFMYDIHTKNSDPPATPLDPPADEVKPGQEFHFDWGASYALGKEDWRLGLAGYYYVQTTDDKIDGEKADSGLRSRQAAIGPALKWWPGMGGFSITAKYLNEFYGTNVKEGDSFWIATTYAF